MTTDIPTFTAKGTIGAWFADVDGKSLPCVHRHWWRTTPNGRMYDDPHFSPETETKWAKFVTALKAHRLAVLTDDTTTDGGLSFERVGYIALWSIDHIEARDGHLRFQFVDRVAHLK